MAKQPCGQQATSTSSGRLWAHLGSRLRFRREQIGISVITAAAGAGVTRQTYAEYELGERLIPANQLAKLAELLKVPVFYFFDDLPTCKEADAGEPTTECVYTVATETERIAALVEDFQRLDFDRQQHLLFVARALVDDASREASR
jgi:transcriptional regulator with XRE-family HTH domain